MDRLEKMISSLGEVVRALIPHAENTEKRIADHDRQIAILRSVAQETNERIGALVSAIGQYIAAQKIERFVAATGARGGT